MDSVKLSSMNSGRVISACRLLRDRLLAFRADSRGNVAITFALATLPLIGAVGAAVDYSRGNSTKASMQAALDAAALTLSKEAQGLSSGQLNQKADAYFKANFNRPEAKNIVITPTFSVLGSGSFKLNLIGKATVDTTISGLWQDKMIIGADSQVIWGYKKLELALALDNTGSMASSNKMAQLKIAAKSLLTTLKTAAKAPGDIKVAIIPFDTTVNLGTSYKNNNWFEWDSLNCGGLPCTALTWKSYWEGCVRDRSYPYDGQDNAPNGSNRKFPVHDCGSLVTLLPLTNDWTQLNSKIDAMQPNGMTNVTIGLAWALHALTPSAPLGEASAPKPDLDKVIILLTDGENTESWKNQNNTVVNTANLIDARTKLACDSIKAANIKLYTIRVIDGNADLLQKCATNPTMYFDVQDAGQLNVVFKTIAQSLASLRLSQ